MSRTLRAVGALAALAALIGGVPWLLIRLAGFPLPTKMPDWANASTMLQQGNIEATTVIKVLACVVWVAWIVTVWAVIWEMLVNVPRLLKGTTRTRQAPLAPRSVSKGVGWLFAALLATSAVSQSAHAASSLGSLAGVDGQDTAPMSLSVDAQLDDGAAASSFNDVAAFDDVYTKDAGLVWVTTGDDSLWSVSQTTGVSIDELLSANDGLTSATFITSNMSILVPSWAQVPTDRLATSVVMEGPSDESVSAETFVASESSVASYVVGDNDGMWNVADALLGDGSRHVEMAQLAVGQQVAPGVVFSDVSMVIHEGWVFTLDATQVQQDSTSPVATYTIQEGDSLSKIADAQMGDEDRWLELWEANAGDTMNDGRTFDDPDLIMPEWEIALVDVTDVISTTDDAVADPVVEAPADVVEAPVEADPVVAADPYPIDEATFPPPVSNPSLVPVPVDTVPSVVDVGAESFEAGESLDVEDAWRRSVWAQIAAGSLLFAGLIVAVRRFRLRRLARLEAGEKLVEPPSAAAGAELAIRRAPDAIEGLSTLRGLMQSLTPYASEQSDPPAVRAVQMSSDRVEVLFSAPAPLPPKGWTTVDGAQSWTHCFDDDAADESRQLLTPALVTIGMRTVGDSDEQVLLDLETAASVSIGGDADAAMGLARAMAFELATYPLGVPLDLCLIGMQVDGTEVCDRVWQDTTLQRAVRVTRQLLDSSAAAGTTSMVAARAELVEDDGAHDPTVFIVNAAAVSEGDRGLLDELVDICQPSTGVAVVVVGSHTNANELLVVDANSKVVWSDVEMTAPMVTREAAAEAAVMLDHAANAESEPMVPSNMMSELLDSTETPVAEDEPTGGEAVDADPVDNDGAAAVRAGAGDDVVVVADEVPEYVYQPPAYAGVPQLCRCELV